MAAVTGTGRGAVLVGAASISTAVAQAALDIKAPGTLAPAVAIAVIVAAVVGVLPWVRTALAYNCRRVCCIRAA